MKYIEKVLPLLLAAGSIVYAAGWQSNQIQELKLKTDKQDTCIKLLQEGLHKLDKTQGELLVEMRHFNENTTSMNTKLEKVLDRYGR